MNTNMSRFNITMVELSQYGVLLIAALYLIPDASPVVRMLTIFLLVVQALLCYFWPQQHPRLILGIELAVACGLVAIDGQVWFIGLLLTVHSMMIVSRNQGLVWISAFVLFFILRSIPADGLSAGLQNGFLVAVSLFSLGLFAAQRTEVYQSLKESRNLLAELQEANRKLQESAAQSEALAVMEERGRLARELHDSAKQEAFAAAGQIAAVREWFSVDPDKAVIHLDEAERLIDSVRQELGGLIQQLRPPGLKDKGLALALKEYAEGWSRQTGIEAEVAVIGERPLPLTFELELFRIAQEALSNTARHSQAARATVLLAITGDTALLEVRDDGRGYNAADVKEGLGLGSMRQRAAALHAEFEIDSAAGKGTRLTLRSPLPIPAGEPFA